MPWQSVKSPSIALGILSEVARRDGHVVEEIHASLRWADFILERTGGAFTPRDYMRVSEEGTYFYGLGEWVFTPALYGVDGYHDAEYSAFLRRRGLHEDEIEEARGLQQHSRAFVYQIADEIAASAPDVVCLTTTFMQNVASLALARRLKAIAPALPIVMGGSNCDGEQGKAMHRAFSELDYVVYGEGERPLRALLAALEGRARIEDVPTLCRRVDGASVVTPPPAAFIPPDEVPAPNYDGYFAQFAQSTTQQYVHPRLVLEFSRGCWWGEKHQCTFCGLNGSGIAFRSKSPEVVVREIVEAVSRYACLDIMVVDNILDMRYFRTVVPELAKLPWDIHLFHEIKSNLSSMQVRALAEARVQHVQPGIESLSSRVLGIMDKGVSGAQNVQLLRDASEHRIDVSWNYLYGFPQELADDYNSIAAQMPNLVHLEPPVGTGRIALERFSPNFDRPEIGFVERKPSEFYAHLYQVAETDLEDLVYLFDTPDCGLTEDEIGTLRAAVKHWQAGYPQSSLTWIADGDDIVVRERRAGRRAGVVRLRGPEALLFAAFRRNDGIAAAIERVAGAGGFSHERVRAAYDVLSDHGLLFVDGGRAVCIALDATACALPEVELQPALLAS